MKTKTASFLLLFAISSVLITTMPSAFAAEVSTPLGTSVPGCEETNECFLPFEIIVDVGDTVTWTNDDTAAHTVTSGDPALGPTGVFDSSIFMADTTFEVTFDTPGTYPYFCMVHPWMTGTVIVGDGIAPEPTTPELTAEPTAEPTAEELLVSIETGEGKAGEPLDVTVTITNMDGSSVENVNYNVIATQGSQIVLDEKGVHDQDGIMIHTTSALPLDPSETMPVSVQVTFNGFGIEQPFTGPVGQIATAQVIPEFGTIAMMILGVGIVSIIALSAKSKIIPKL